MEQRSLISSCMEDTANKSPVKSAKHHQWWQGFDRAFLSVGVIKRKKEKCAFCSINAKGMLIFIVADIWNCYNMDMKKATNLKVLIIFKQPHCMEIRNRLSLK